MLPQNFTYSYEIQRWTERSLDLNITMSDPLAVSRNRNEDIMITSVINPSWFVSAENGLTLKQSNF